ncbi:MAG TPA: SDR family oxidoreductase, partial [Phycisphaerales bacterium]|nr:SDR family oxidoreductase [Phycisphaerales bacterium]
MPQLRTALVTGAGSGIGREVSLLLAAQGCTIILVGRTISKLRETARLITALNAPAPSVYAVDLADIPETEKFVSRILADPNHIDLLVNNAAVAPYRLFQQGTVQHFNHALSANLISPFVLIRALWSSLLQNKGCVINVSSMATVSPFP